MLGETQLHFQRIDPLPGNFDQIVGTAAKKIKTVGVAHKTVAGIDPSSLTDSLRGLVRPVPVLRRRGIAAHPQNAFLVVADLAAVTVLQRDLIAGYPKPRGAELFLLGAVAEIDVHRFRRAQPLDDLETG